MVYYLFKKIFEKIFKIYIIKYKNIYNLSKD